MKDNQFLTALKPEDAATLFWKRYWQLSAMWVFHPLMGLWSQQRQVLLLCQKPHNTTHPVISTFHPMNQQISNQECPVQMWKPFLRRGKLQMHVTGKAQWRALLGYQRRLRRGSSGGLLSNTHSVQWWKICQSELCSQPNTESSSSQESWCAVPPFSLCRIRERFSWKGTKAM